MRTQILNLKGSLYDAEARLVNVQTVSGEITILPHHRPLMSVLKKNAGIYLDDTLGKRHEFKTHGGFLHLDTNGHLTLLVD
jgi:F0F1-type ATP synthase epsilon subunit